MRALLKPVVFSVLATALNAAPSLAADEVFINSKELKWGDAPPSLPKGGKVAVLNGDPGKAGPFTLRLMAPAGYSIAPHMHSRDENLTVISGTLYLSMGDKADKSHGHALTAGGYHYLPAKTNHYAYTKAATVVQVSGEGPFDIVYVNPADDPQKGAKK
jgi:quercetin dioxygenase-like cupin family protein